MMDAPEILREAAGVLAGGWCKNDYERDGKVCSMGALQRAYAGDATHVISTYAVGDHPEYTKAIEALAEVMREQFAWEGFWVEGWEHPHRNYIASEQTVIQSNDGYAQDVAEVIACMEKAATNLESQYP